MSFDATPSSASSAPALTMSCASPFATSMATLPAPSGSGAALIVTSKCVNGERALDHAIRVGALAAGHELLLQAVRRQSPRRAIELPLVVAGPPQVIEATNLTPDGLNVSAQFSADLHLRVRQMDRLLSAVAQRISVAAQISLAQEIAEALGLSVAADPRE